MSYMLRSTYRMEYKSEKNMFALSRESIRPDYYTEEKLSMRVEKE